MPEAKYLLVGSSHAALEALRAIRQVDGEGSIAMVTRDSHLPYSPTVLPYVVSGRSAAERVLLRDQAFFAANHCSFVANATAVGLDAAGKRVSLADGAVWNYDKLLIATGSAPAIPPIPGLGQNLSGTGVPAGAGADTGRDAGATNFHVLRTLDDAKGLRQAMGQAKRAVVLGAGLVGLHAAENLAEAGLAVDVVEMQAHVLPGYFDSRASARIEACFAAHGVKLHLGRRVVRAEGGRTLVLDDDSRLEADLLLVAAGVRPVVEWLAGSGIDLGQGVLVDDRMRTSLPDVWAAGDVAQATDFHSGRPALIGIIPTAVEQGRIAGMAMAGDPYLLPYAGGVPINTYRFFGRVALSIGQATASQQVEVSESEAADSAAGYRRVVMAEGRLVGYASIDEPFDVGIMGELIRRRVDLTDCKDAFLARPLETGRRLMSEGWR